VLFKAVHDNNLERLQQLADGGIDLEQFNGVQQTPLIVAALLGHADVVRFLLDRGVDATKAEGKGYNAMHAAAFKGKRDVVQMLVDHGLPYDEPHTDGLTPFVRAVAMGSVEVARLFLRLGVDVDSTFNHEQHGTLSALQVASHPETRQLLERYKAAKDGGGEPPHHEDEPECTVEGETCSV
jgi:ankyrin repeat protein